MSLFNLIRKSNGRLQLYCCGKRILSFGRKNVLKPSSNYFIHRKYGKVWYPYYLGNDVIQGGKPDIYNKNGQKMDLFFIRDTHTSANPYSGSKYFEWDRYNIALDTHFYSHKAMLETMGKPTRRYGFFIEPRTITPIDYRIFEKFKGLEKDFDAVFTADDKLLNEIPNAKFFPGCAVLWYPEKKMNPTAYQNKTKDISILSSHKHQTEYHLLRLACANRCKRLGCADTFGTFDGGPRVEKEDTLAPYRYSIVIENVRSPGYFTEKILDCFAAQTIPIYLGATDIGRFFNPDGIIQIQPEDINHIEDILKQCTPEAYTERLAAVQDNYRRVQAYRNNWDWLYEHYFLKEEHR